MFLRAASYYRSWSRPPLLLLPIAIFTVAVHRSTLNAQPVNDNFANAIVIPSDLTCGSFEADATMATAEPGEPEHEPGAASKSLWWKWKPRYAGETVFGLTTGRATIAIYQGATVSSLQRVGIFAGNVIGFDWDCSNPRDDFGAKAIATDPATNYWIAVNGTATWTFAQRTLELVSSTAGQRLTLGSSPTVQLETIDHEFDHATGSGELILGRTVSPLGRPIRRLRTLGTSAAPHRFSWRPTAPGFWWLWVRATNSLGQARQTAPILHEVAPANDDFTHATVISPHTRSANFTFSFAAASVQPGEPAHTHQTGPSLWWKWTPSYSGRVELETSHSRHYGIPLDIFTGKRLTNLILVADSNRSSLGGFGDGVRLTVKAGVTYRIRVLPRSSPGTQRLILRPYVPPAPASPTVPDHVSQTYQRRGSMLPYSFRGVRSRGSSSSGHVSRRFGFHGFSLLVVGTNSVPNVRATQP